MRKVWIGTIQGLSCVNPRSELCTDNLWIGHILAHALFPVWHVYANWTMVHHCCWAADENPFWESFLSTKKVGSKFLTWESVCIKSTCMYRNALYTDRIWLLSAVFDRVSQRPSYMYAQKRNIIDNSWLCSIIFNQVDSTLLVIHVSSSALSAIQGLAVHPYMYFAPLVRCNLWIAW